jgi:NitT/TauT family transport system substrate-binding protein
MNAMIRSFFKAGAAASLSLALAAPVAAEEIAVSHYGITSGGYAYAVAKAKGFFQEEGADVTGIISSHGGGTTIRNMLSSDVPYAEASPGAVVSAIQEGVDLIIIADTMSSVADLNWVVLKDSKLHSIDDLKGAKIGYTNPKSTTNALDLALLDAAGLTEDDVELTKTGGFGEGMAALESGLIDVTPLGEPLWTINRDKYRLLVRGADVLPLLNNVVAITTKEKAVENGDFLRAVLRARLRAVEFMHAHPDEAAAIIAKEYKLDLAVTKAALDNLLSIESEGVPYIGTGEFHLKGLEQMLALQKRVGSISGEWNLEKMIDASYLPKELQGKM